MEDLNLKELYRLATGNVQVDMDDIVDKIKNSQSEAEKQELIGKILYTVPGGVGNAYISKEFRTKFYTELRDKSYTYLVADVNKDGDVNKADYDEVKSYQLDITNDGKFDSDDLNLVKTLSTVEIVEDNSDEEYEAVDFDEAVEDDVKDTPEEVQK